MKRRVKLKASDGFTIIETLIVLTIAGFMLLLVFEAIPVLQLSGRNNERKQDVTAILEAVSHWELNHSGTFPSPCGDQQSDLCTATPNEGNKYTIVNPLHYTNLNIYSHYDSQAGYLVMKALPYPLDLNTHDYLPPPNPDANNKVYVYNYLRCDPAGGGKVTPNGAGYNDVVALYDMEQGNGGSDPKCQAL